MTFNIWDLEIPTDIHNFQTTEDLQERVKVMGKWLKWADADVIAIQEAWINDHRDKIIKDSEMPYQVSYNPLSPFTQAVYDGIDDYFYGFGKGLFLLDGKLGRGMGGNGLLILSKYPLEKISKNGGDVVAFPDYSATEEFLVYKGAIRTKVITPHGDVNFINTHLGAGEKYSDIRLKQLETLKGFVSDTVDKSNNPLLLMGDLNGNPSGSEYNFVTEKLLDEGQFVDAYPLETRPSHGGFTQDAENPYFGDGSFAEEGSQRIDYGFYRDSDGFKVENSTIFFDSPVANGKRLSDHYGVLMNLKLDKKTD